MVTKVEPDGGLNSAVTAVMAEIRSLAKEDKNAHGGYTFAGIDAFLDLTRPLCAKHGLTIRQDEEGFEVIEVPSKNGPQKMLLMRFGFTLVRGNECDGPYRRSIMVPASMGSQAFGAAQSYTLKQFLRSLFQISTGEKGEDIDAHNTGELGTYAPPKNGNGRDAPFPHGPAKNKQALKDLGRAYWKDVMACEDRDAFDALRVTHKELEKQLQEALPEWWNGGQRKIGDNYESYEGLGTIIERMDRDFDAIAANGMDFHGNVLRAG